MIMEEATLRRRYRQLQERRAAGAGSAVPLETIEALAEERIQGPARMTALDQVLADPVARAEYEFLREVAAERPRQVPSRRRWLVAAAFLVTVAGGLLWRASSPGEEPLRGSGAAVLLGLPAENATLVPGDRLSWRRVAGAAGYRLEVVTSDGEVAFRAETTDTFAVLMESAGRPIPAGPAQWWVIARLGGASELRSPPRRVVLGR